MDSFVMDESISAAHVAQSRESSRAKGYLLMNVSIQPSTIESALPIPRDLQVGDFVRIRGTKDVGRVTAESYFS
jgi:hypothetical protein